MDIAQLSPLRPYLLRAHYDWLLDNDLTPHIIVDVNQYGVSVPIEYAQNGRLILNISPRAVGHLQLSNDDVSFNARFGGVLRQVTVPMSAVIAVYARENGIGMEFESEFAYGVEDEQGDSDALAADNLVLIHDAKTSRDRHSPDNPFPDDEPPQPPKGRPALRVVK